MKPTYFNVDRFSHHFVVRDLSAAGIQIINTFASQYVEWGWVGSGRFSRKVPLRVFAAKVKPQNLYRFHHGQWDEFITFLRSKSIDITDLDVSRYGFNEAAPLDCSITDKKTPFDYQVGVIDYLVKPEPAPIKLVEIQTGKGKALPYDARILTTKGWKSMGALEVGDFIIDPNYRQALVTGKYDQGKTPTIEFVSEDGRLFECSDQHLWNAYHAIGSDVSLITAATMASTIKHGEKVFLKLPMHPDGREKIPEDLTMELVLEHLQPSTTVYNSEPHSLNLETVYLAVLSSMVIHGRAHNGEFAINLRHHHNQTAFAEFVWYLGGSLVPIEEGGYEYYLRTPYNDIMYRVLCEHWGSPLSPGDDAFSYRNGVYLRIMDYEPTGERETCCIEVANDEREFIIDNYIPTHNTFCAMSAAVKLGKRILMFLKPQFIEKWVGDCEELIGATSDEVEVIQGSAKLMKAIDEAKRGVFDKKVVIISNRTFQNWIKEYEQVGEDILDQGYGCLPNEIFDLFKIGLRLIDEVHMDFHLNFKIDLYTHVEHSISLSATLISDLPFVAKMQRIAYPPFLRYKGLPYDRYVDSVAWCWSLANARLVQTTERGSTKYSHNAFEKSILKNIKLLESYLLMHVDILKFYYANRRVDGDKCLIYCASIAMCTVMAEYLQRQFPDLTVKRYVELDPYENLMTPDISVSTVLSAGTGHDIGGLITVVLGHSIKSSASNMQGFGRIRKLAGKKLLFVYLTCIDIPKQVEYYETKEELLKTMALSATRYDLVKQIG